jgi:hypothetical protein
MYRLSVLMLTCVLTAGATAFAQKSSDASPVLPFGKITPDQFRKPVSDTTAEAIVHYELGEVKYEIRSEDVWIVLEKHVRIEIRRKSAYDRATISLPVRQGPKDEFIANLEGNTYNLVNGMVTVDKLTKKERFTERVSDTYAIEKFTFPNVREGSIIEYKYSIRTPFSISINPKTWHFQQDIPVNWSEYRIAIPDYFYYKIILGGYINLAVNEQKKLDANLGFNGVTATAYRFAVKNAPAFRNESYMTTDDDYLSKIDFELASYTAPNEATRSFSVSWTDLDKTLLEDPNFGGQFKRATFLRETAKTLLSQYPDTLARITAAYDYVRQHMKWDETTALWSENIRNPYDAKQGDAAAINMLLIALLREMTIDANPVILSTRPNGHIDEKYALIRKFNYVVAQVWVGGRDLLLDATDPYLAPGMLPLHCLNGTGRLVHPTQARFITLAPAERDAEAYTGKFVLNDEGGLSGTLLHSHGGYSAWSTRKAYQTEGQAKYLEGVQKKNVAWQIDKADFTGTDRKDAGFTAAYTLTVPEACSRAGDRLYLLPMFTEGHTENPFKEKERLYPVDFGVAIDETFKAAYTLPKGYEVEEMPKSLSMELPGSGGRFIYQVLANGNEVTILSRILLRKTVFYAADYPFLRELFNQIVAKHAEQVVLKSSAAAEKK